MITELVAIFEGEAPNDKDVVGLSEDATMFEGGPEGKRS